MAEGKAHLISVPMVFEGDQQFIDLFRRCCEVAGVKVWIPNQVVSRWYLTSQHSVPGARWNCCVKAMVAI